MGRERKQLLRVLRAQQEPKLTQSHVAKLAQARLPKGQTMSMQRYWQIEHGDGSEPSPDEKSAVAAALGVKVSDIAWPEFAKAKAS